MKVLLCTNNSPYAIRALQLGASIAKQIANAVDILSVSKEGQRRKSPQAETVAAELRAAGIPTSVIQRVGELGEETVQQARETTYDLIVVGSRGRRGMKRILLGSVALHIAERTTSSVLVLKGRPRELHELLICSAAGPVSQRTVDFAGHLAHGLSASVTVLHVMSQLPLVEDALLTDLEASADELIQRGSREGAHLSRMISNLAEQEVKARAVVRHGLILDEVLAEAQEGQYDVIIVGEHCTPGLKPALVDNLSADILLSADRSVLVVR